jgi:hypothetical protein
MNFAEHAHDINPVTWRCRICGADELELLLDAQLAEFLQGEPLQEFLERTHYWLDPERIRR